MGSTDEDLTVREAVLLVISAAGANIGRTSLQKLCYFAGIALNEDLGHRAHYYGPYSRHVEVALENETFAGDLVESMRTFVSYSSNREGRSYSYELSDQGNEVVASIREAKPEAAATVDQIVGRLGQLVPEFPQQRLSVAAKVDLILHQQGSMAADEIPAIAKGLGWEVSEKDVDDAVNILVGLNRVAASTDADAS